jgi:hypothetical protein
MATQTIEFRAPTAQAVTAKLFAIGSDTQVASASATEATNRKGTYAAAFTDVAAGTYDLIAFVSITPVARWFVKLTLTTATFQATDTATVESAISALQGADGDTLETLSDQIDGIEGGGSSNVTVLPATGIVANRSAGVTLLPVVGETISQAITVYQSDGTTAVNLSGKTLRVVFETMSGVDVAVVPAADITIGGTGSNVVTFAYPSAVTASERTLRFALRDAAAPLTMYLQGVCSVISAPKVDT